MKREEEEEEEASRPLNAGHPSFAKRAESLGRDAKIFKGLKGHVEESTSTADGSPPTKPTANRSRRGDRSG